MNQPKSKNQAKSKPTNKTEGLEIVSQKDSPIDVKGKVVETQTKYAKIARQCDHVMTNGEFCRAVALRGRKYCFFHLIHIGRRLRAERVHELAMAIQCDSSAMAMELPLLEDANAIQLALSQVIDDVMHSRLDNKRAGLVLYALQTASANLANGVDLGQRDGATAACRYDDFEEDYQLGCTAPELKVEEEPVAEGLPEDPHKPKDGLYGAPAPQEIVPHIPKDGMYGAPARMERDAPSRRLEVVPAAHLQGRKTPVFAFVQRESSG
ncbi:MAG: hypothetical protein ACLP3R_15745 [Candidatus Korobacteraceae bacterium]|jgi:hypothetical protein